MQFWHSEHFTNWRPSSIELGENPQPTQGLISLNCSLSNLCLSSTFCWSFWEAWIGVPNWSLKAVLSVVQSRAVYNNRNLRQFKKLSQSWSENRSIVCYATVKPDFYWYKIYKRFAIIYSEVIWKTFKLGFTWLSYDRVVIKWFHHDAVLRESSK